MIIQCTACEKKFSVPDLAITPAGRLVQCSSCGNKWTQYPIKKEIIKPKKTTTKINIPKKKTTKKKSTPTPYSKEYMMQKWGGTIQDYATNKGISKKEKAAKKQKISKHKTDKKLDKPGFGFFNYIITTFVITVFFIGILNFERTRLSRKFPFLEPYINHFFETLENFYILILDFYK